MAFDRYIYVNGEVKALQLKPETQFTIAETLVGALLSDQLNHFLATYPVNAACLQLEWRYKDSSKTFVLKEGMFLVVMNTSRCMPMAKDEFEAVYMNTSADPIIKPEDTKTVSKAIVDFVNKFYPEAGMTEDKLNTDALQQMVNGLSAWYDKKNNIFDVKFADCGLTDPTGIGSFLKACPAASFMDAQTTFTLNFNNGAFNAGDPNTLPNYFNAIGLNKLIGELQKLDIATLQRLRGISFQSVKEGSPSAITPSVSNEFWQSFQQTICQITGVETPSKITR